MNNPEKLAKYWVYKTNTNNTKTQHDMCWSQLDANKCKLHSYPDLHLHVRTLILLGTQTTSLKIMKTTI